MNCAEWTTRIDSYVDAELPPDEVEAFRAHAASCAHCAAQALAAAESKLAVRRVGNRYQPSAALRERAFATVRPKAFGVSSVPAKPRATIPPATLRSWSRWAMAAAAVLLIAAGWLLVANQRQKNASLAEFADLHVAALASANPVEVVSTDRHTVKPWFQGRIPFTFDLPELQGSPFTLVGGRVAYFHQEPGAQLIFSYQRHLISVFVFRDTPQLGIPFSSIADRSSSFALQSWQQGGLRYVVIGDAGSSTIGQLAQLLQRTGAGS